MKYINMAISRGETTDKLLEYPILSRPIYLLEKNSTALKKSQESDITTAILASNDKNDVICAEAPGKCPHIKTDAVVVDVMSVARRFTAKELVGVKTLGDLCEILLNVTVKGYGAQSNKVALVSENYKQHSPKAAERLRRMATNKVGRVYSVLSENQSVPDMEEFWSVQENKSSFLEL